MNYLFFAYQSVLDAMKIQFTLLSFTFSMWDVFLWSCMAGAVIWFIGRMFFD